MNGIMQDQAKGGPDVETKLHIFVNRRKFGVEQGVKEVMTGREIAALVDVPVENAVVRQDSGPNKREIDIDSSITVEMGDHFLVTRKTVEGGCVA
jgi:hypothetical protein